MSINKKNTFINCLVKIYFLMHHLLSMIYFNNKGSNLSFIYSFIYFLFSIAYLF